MYGKPKLPNFSEMPMYITWKTKLKQVTGQLRNVFK